MGSAIFRCLAVLVYALSLTANPAWALSLADLSNKDTVDGLKAALDKGTQVAVQRLGAENGFFGNDKLKIPLPESLQRVERALRLAGMGKQADELVLRMNRAAEAAVPEAKALFVTAIKQMSVQDAKAILTGGNDSATQYFKRTTSAPLEQKFLPIVKKSMAKVKLAEIYDQYAGKAAQLGLINKDDVNLENYVTRKGLEGLFVVVQKGSLIHDSKEARAMSLVYVSHKEGAYEMRAGAEGMEGLIVRFPNPVTQSTAAAKGAKPGERSYQCLLCAYAYEEKKGAPEDGIAPGTHWENVPEDWTCPDCAAGKDGFELLEA